MRNSDWYEDRALRALEAADRASDVSEALVASNRARTYAELSVAAALLNAKSSPMTVICKKAPTEMGYLS
jgi:hypothetical protein